MEKNVVVSASPPSMLQEVKPVVQELGDLGSVSPYRENVEFLISCLLSSWSLFYVLIVKSMLQ